MISLSDFAVGQTVVVVGECNRKSALRATVGRVGKKYVTLTGAWPMQFFVRSEEDDSLTEKTGYGAPASLYPSEDAYNNMLRKCELREIVRESCSWPQIGLLTLDQLQRITTILRENDVAKLHAEERGAQEK